MSDISAKGKLNETVSRMYLEINEARYRLQCNELKMVDEILKDMQKEIEKVIGD